MRLSSSSRAHMCHIIQDVEAVESAYYSCFSDWRFDSQSHNWFILLVQFKWPWRSIVKADLEYRVFTFLSIQSGSQTSSLKTLIKHASVTVREGYSLCQATDGANQQANRTSWTDGAHSDLLTAQFCRYSLISPVSRSKESHRSGVWSQDFTGLACQPVGNYQTEGLIVSDLLERGKDEGKCGAASPPLLSSLPSSVRVFVF